MAVAVGALSGCTADSVTTTPPTATAPADPATGTSGPADASVRDEPIEACDVLTPERAVEILGPVADVPTSTAPTAGDADAAVTSCTYLAADRNERDGRISVGLVVRTALSAVGAGTNRDRFAPAGLPPEAQQVDGIGERAFWAPGLGQLNVLADDQWYVLTYGGLDPRQNSLSETREAAAVLEDGFGSTASGSVDPAPPTEGETP